MQGIDIIGTITIEKLEEIAKIKLADLNCDAACTKKFSLTEQQLCVKVAAHVCQKH